MMIMEFLPNPSFREGGSFYGVLVFEPSCECYGMRGIEGLEGGVGRFGLSFIFMFLIGLRFRRSLIIIL